MLSISDWSLVNKKSFFYLFQSFENESKNSISEIYNDTDNNIFFIIFGSVHLRQQKFLEEGLG